MHLFRIHRPVLCLLSIVVSITLALPSFAQDTIGKTDADSTEARQIIYLPLVSSNSVVEQDANADVPPTGIEGPEATSSRVISETLVEIVQGASANDTQEVVINRYGTEDTVVIPIVLPDSNVSVASVNTPDEKIGNVNVALTRYIDFSTQGVDPPNYNSRAVAKTTTDQCVGGVWAEAKQKYWGKSGTFYRSPVTKYDLNIFCYSSAQATMSYMLTAPGTSHRSITKHSVKVSSTWYNYYGPSNNGYESQTYTK